MATNVFHCLKCDKDIEVISQSLSVKAPEKCSNCGGVEFQKIFAPPKAIIYKCKGFYCTDKDDF